MSAQTYQPLHAVPPLTDNHVRMAWLLRLRHAARVAFDAALAAPRQAAGYIRKLVTASRLGAAASWLRRASARLLQPLLGLTHRVGSLGIVAGVTSAVTSPAGRRVLNKAGSLLGRAFGWVARTVYSGIDRGLRMFGKAGNRAADVLFAGMVSLGGKIAAVATPVVHRVARLSDPEAAHVRLLSGVARSFFVHRLLKAFIANPLVRLLVEGVLLPVALDSKVASWFRDQLKVLRQRAQSLQQQAEDVKTSSGPEQSAGGRDATPVVDLPLPLCEELDLDEPAPANRAERRAQQRQHRRPA